MDGRFVGYLRVSTERQGRSGLGIEAQREAVAQFLNGGDWRLLGEYVEVESGKRDDRPELAKALAHCRRTGATLVIAKLDRLSRDLAFLANLMKSGTEFVACDNPHATRFTVHILAAVAEHEREMISARTKAALAAAKARGKRLGGWRGGPTPDHRAGTAALQRHAAEFTASVGPAVVELHQAGLSLRQIAAELTKREIRTSRGGVWTAASVAKVLARVENQAKPREAA